ncbi:MAG TPA: hypothetical protein VMZ27_01545 [Candidatus Saccharimonadales bacterium]|nr:hypothetical protein [Candidatus Saccharimonadales bacterium]
MHKKTIFLFCLLSGFVSAAVFADTPLVNHGDAWRYHKGTNSPQANWKTVSDATLDATWGTGNGGLGYADNAPETANCQTLLTDMDGRYSTLYIRRQFQVTTPPDPSAHLLLRMDWDDGFIAWLDGNHLTNGVITGAPAEPVYTAVASGNHESSLGNAGNAATFYDLGPIGSRLAVGTHTLAIMGLNVTIGSSDFVLIPDLSVGVPPPPETNTWFAANSPITVNTNFTVSRGSTLVIEAGTTVQFGSGINLTVADGGTLIANGTSNAPIHFTRSGASGNWGQIIVNGSVGSPETQIAYATFNFNIADGNKPAIQVNAGTVLLDHLTFATPQSPYVHVDNASFVIRDCYFPAAASAFEPCHGTVGIKSGGRGLFLRNFFGPAVGYSDVIDFTGGNRSGPITEYIDNVFMGTGDDILDLDSTDSWVEGNIFLHVHKNGSPDSASAVSGGKDNNDTSQVTIIGNIFFDCDQAATAKQGNFFTLLNNTIVHQNRTGGTDTDAGVVNVADAGTVEATGMYLEGNIVYDIEKLARNVSTSIVTYANNILPVGWAGPGGGNVVADPLFKHIPQLSETAFTNWAQAQIIKDWLSLLSNSPGIGTGPNGRDMGGVIPLGASISGEPSSPTTQGGATLTVGMNRIITGPAQLGWPNGTGFTHYKWRLDGTNTWSLETGINTPISLNNLQPGTHFVDVIGKHDSGIYQDDPAYGTDAVITRSKSWTVQGQIPLQISAYSKSGNTFTLHFTAQAGQTYSVLSKLNLTDPTWSKVQDVPAQPSTGDIAVPDNAAGGATKFYRLVTPAQ